MKINKTYCYIYFLYWFCTTASFCEISNKLKPCEKFSNSLNKFSWFQNFICIVKRLITRLLTHIQLYVICLLTFLSLYLTFRNSIVVNQEKTNVTNSFVMIISIFFNWNEILWYHLNFSIIFGITIYFFCDWMIVTL